MRVLWIAAVLCWSGCVSNALTTVVDAQTKAIKAALPEIESMCKPVLEACKVAKLQQADERWQCVALTSCHRVQTKLVQLLLTLQQVAVEAAS